jgi:hypothetical protein
MESRQLAAVRKCPYEYWRDVPPTCCYDDHCALGIYLSVLDAVTGVLIELMEADLFPFRLAE